MPIQVDPAWPASLRWAVQYLPHYFTHEPCRLHVELFEALEEPAARLVACVAPRGHAKSTCAALAYPLWCICQRRRRNIVIVSHESSLARQFVRDLRGELESNEQILADYGALALPAGEEPEAAAPTARSQRARAARRPKWTEDCLVTSTGIAVQAKGSGAGFRGLRVGPRRPDLVICDDLEKDALVDSARGRRKLEHWLQRVVMPALAPRGQLVVLGSLLHSDGLLANLRDARRFPRWRHLVFRAIEARPRPDGTFDRAALWPALWPLERLDEERQRVGTLAFEQEYQANPVDETVRVFRPEWLRRPDEPMPEPERLVTIIAVDPATGVAGGDYFALWVGSVDRAAQRIFTRELTLERIGIVDQVRRVLAACERWNPVRIGVETTAYQVALRDILLEEGRRRGRFLPVVGLQPTQSKRARIEALAPLFERGEFRLPGDLSAEAERQFMEFPRGEHDDAPDVCALGMQLAQSLTALRVECAVARRT